MTLDVVAICSVSLTRNKLFCQCRNCNDVVVATVTVSPMKPVSLQALGNLTDSGVTIDSILPPTGEPCAPQDTPKDVAMDFVEGLRVLQVKAYSSAGNCFRRALEKATYHLLNKLDLGAGEHKDMNLYSRIKLLRDRSLIAPQLYDWAEIIRDLGNKGSHGDVDFSEKDAVELKDFTGIFLIYVFTMPARVHRMRTASPAGEKE